MKLLAKILDMVGGLDGIKKIGSGKKTYLTSASLILFSAGMMVYAFYQFSEKEIDINAFLTIATLCGGFVVSGAKDIFQRMATAKTEVQIKAVQKKLGETCPGDGK